MNCARTIFEILMSRLRNEESIEKLRELIEVKREQDLSKEIAKPSEQIEVGDRVLLWNPAKRITEFEQTKWTGPYFVKTIDEYGNFYLNGLLGTLGRTPINRQRLRKIPNSSGQTEGMREELLVRNGNTSENESVIRVARSILEIGNNDITGGPIGNDCFVL